MKLSIKNKIIYLYSAIITIFIFIAAILAYQFIYDDLLVKEDLELNEISNCIVEFIDNETNTLDFKKFRNTDEEHYFVIFKDSDLIWKSRNINDKIAFMLNQNLDQAKLESNLSEKVSVYSITDNENEYRYIERNYFAYKLRIAYSTDRISQMIKEVYHYFYLLIPLAILLSIISVIILSKFTLSSIDQIVNKAKDITASNLSGRLPGGDSKDEIGRLINTINEMIERLQKSFKQIERFTSDVSHELRTPLTILRGEIELALHETKKPEEYEDLLISALDEVNRLSNMVQKMLELSRAEYGKIDMNFDWKNLSHQIMDVSDDLEILVDGKSISIETDIEENIYIEYDAGRFHQVVLNLVDNAVKYTPAGGKIFIGLKKYNDYVEFIVADTGYGIPEEDLDHIFDRLYRIDKSRSQEIQGIGLGLAIVKWICDAHQAEIKVESKAKEGSIFKVKLPIYQNHKSIN